MLGLIVTAAYVASLIVAFKKNKSAFFSLVFIGAPLLPVLYIPALGEASFAERYLYLPSVGFVTLAALLVVRARNSFPRGVPALNIVLIILIGLYSAATVIRNTAWKDNITLFADTVKKVPDGATPHNNLGHAYESNGQLDKAIVHYRMAVKLKPDYVDAYTNLGNAYDSAGLTDMAIEQYQTALRLKPDSAETHFNLGVAYEIPKGRPEMAIEHYQIALRIKPHFAEPHFGLGRVYLKQGALDMARKEFETGLSIKPDDYRAQQALNSLISR
jgi:tetratricopeptide (TPR) repeat protein